MRATARAPGPSLARPGSWVNGTSSRNPERSADRVEFAYVDDAAHFITDDAPAAVADLAIDLFERAA
jgi:hypothetical protein